MAYLGRNLANLSDRVVLDSLTASATASYTLQLNSVNFVPSSAESLTVSLNGVIQAPISSYTVSGSTLTFASALTSSDSIDFIIAERGITLQTPSAGSVGTSQLATNSISTIKIQDDAVTFDKMTGQNYPAFFAHKTASQTITNLVNTKVTWDTDPIDTDSAFASDKFTVPSGKGGKYIFSGSLQADAVTDSNLQFTDWSVYKNGSAASYQLADFRTNYAKRTPAVFNVILDLSAGDYIELYIRINDTSGSPKIAGNSSYPETWFQGYRIGD